MFNIIAMVLEKCSSNKKGILLLDKFNTINTFGDKFIQTLSQRKLFLYA